MEKLQKRKHVFEAVARQSGECGYRARLLYSRLYTMSAKIHMAEGFP